MGELDPSLVQDVQYRELLIGCGYTRQKRITVPGTVTSMRWSNLTTLDINERCDPDLWCDLNAHPPWIARSRRIPRDHAQACELLSDWWDEIHAYEVLEHLGQQGDAASLLAQFAELWRILKPNGYLCATVPSRFSEGLWGDPSHRRVILPMTLTFLDQEQYARQCDGPVKTAMSDFRSVYKADFKLIEKHDNRETFSFVLQAIKPSRYVEK